MKIIKKITSIIVILGIILTLPIMGVYAVADEFSDDFEGYSNYTSHDTLIKALSDKWVGTLEKSPQGTITVEQQFDKYDKNTNAVHISANAQQSYTDPFLQYMTDWTEDNYLSCDIKFDSIDTEFAIMSREATPSGVLLTPFIEKAANSPNIKVFGTELSNLIIEPDKWYHFSLATDYDSAEKAFAYSVWIDGEGYADNETYSTLSNASFKLIGLRFYVRQEKGTSGGIYLDNVIIRPANIGFKNMHTIPENNQADISTENNNVQILFSTDIDKSTLHTDDIKITKITGKKQTDVIPSDIKIYADAIDIILSNENLDYSSEYKIELPQGIADVLGNTLPENKRMLTFLTEADPDNKIPQVKLVKPDKKISVMPNGTVELEAEASDEDGYIDRVVFYADDEEIDTVETAPYKTEWKNIPVGTHIVCCRAWDNNGAAVKSQSVEVISEENIPPTARLVSPANLAEIAVGSAVNVTVVAEDKNGDDIKKVELYVNGKYAGEALNAPYLIEWAPETNGTYTLTAKAYDAYGGGEMSERVIVTAKTKLIETVFEYDFETYDGTDNNVPAGGMTNTNNIGVFSPANVDEEHGTSMRCDLTGNQTAGPLFLITPTNTKKGDIIAAEAELMVTNTANRITCFETNANNDAGERVWGTELEFRDGNIVNIKTNQTLMPYETNKWYKIKMVFDFTNKRCDISINGETLVSAQEFVETEWADLLNMRFTLFPQKADTGTMYLDNIRIARVITASEPISITAYSDKSEELKENNAEQICEIGMKMSSALLPSSVSESSIKLYKEFSNTAIPCSVSYDSALMSIMVKPQIVLENDSAYRIVIGDGVKDSNGIVLQENQEMTLYTACSELNITNSQFTGNNGKLSSVMQLSKGDMVSFNANIENKTTNNKKIFIITAVYDENRLIDYSIKSDTISSGESRNVTGAQVLVTEDSNSSWSVCGYILDAEKGFPLGAQYRLK